MEISLENRMLQAVQSEDLETVTLLLSKGANPNKTVSNGKTCLGEAAFRGLTDIAKKLIAESHSDKKHSSEEEEANECYCSQKNKNKEASIKPLRKRLNKLTMYTNTKCKAEQTSKEVKEPSKKDINKGYYKLSHGDGSTSEDSKEAGIGVPLTPVSPQTDLEWDEDIGNVAASTKEDELMTAMYKWYASILESTGAAVVAASDYTCGIDQEDAYGRTALNYAADENNVEIIKALVEAGCKLDLAGSTTGWTALHASCASNRIDVVRVLLAAGSNVNVRTPIKTTALHIAACNGLEMLKLVVDHNAILDLRDEKERTALYIAAAQGHTSVVKYLIDRGANINIEDGDGHTALCTAVSFKHIDTVRVLLAYGARITHYQCLLHTAIRQLKLDMVKLLASHGCGINVHNSIGETPLLLTMTIDNPLPFARILLKKGANVNACNSHSGASALHVAVEFTEDPKEFESLLNLLLDYSIDLDKRASTRDTALNRAILLHKDRIAMQLIRYGANVNLCEVLTNVFGNLIIASNRKSNRLANMLIKAGHNKVKLNLVYNPKKTAKWITEMYKTPLSLANICRIRIRGMRSVQRNLRDFVASLPIPDMMKKFLMMEEMVC